MTDPQIPQPVLDDIARAAAGHYPGWADNDHPDARAYNAYRLGAVEHYQRAAALGPEPTCAAAGYERLREVLTKYVASTEATANEVFLRFRGGRSWTRAEFAEELRTNGPQALNMMVTMMASAAYLVSHDKLFPLPADQRQLLARLEHLAGPVVEQYPLPWQATTSYPPYISVPAAGKPGVHRKIVDGMGNDEVAFITELVNAWPQLRALMGGPAVPVDEQLPLEAGPKAPLAHREAARDLYYALRDLQPLDSGPNDYAARNLILAAFAKIGQASLAE